MKKLFTCLSTLVLLSFAFNLAEAQSPNKVSYQAVVRNSSNQLVSNKAIGMKISILQGSVSGTAVYVETQTPTTNDNGLVTAEIGGGSVLLGVFSTIDWKNGPYFLKTETDPTGGTNYTIVGSSQILSVPYALYAQTASTAENAATKADLDALEIRIEALEAAIGSGTLKDIDGNSYKIVTIGSQTWMAENLKTTQYNDGTAIPLIADSLSWNNRAVPAYCWYRNDESTYKAAYGALYNWHTVNTGKLCPSGWHVPNDDEWTILTTYLGGESVSGVKLKEAGTTHWMSPNKATNETGFSAIPQGIRNYLGHFYNLGLTGYWWSSTTFVSPATAAWARTMTNNADNVQRGGQTKPDGLSVRCLKD